MARKKRYTESAEGNRYQEVFDTIRSQYPREKESSIKKIVEQFLSLENRDGKTYSDTEILSIIEEKVEQRANNEEGRKRLVGGKKGLLKKPVHSTAASENGSENEGTPILYTAPNGRSLKQLKAKKIMTKLLPIAFTIVAIAISLGVYHGAYPEQASKDAYKAADYFYSRSIDDKVNLFDTMYTKLSEVSKSAGEKLNNYAVRIAERKAQKEADKQVEQEQQTPGDDVVDKGQDGEEKGGDDVIVDGDKIVTTQPIFMKGTTVTPDITPVFIEEDSYKSIQKSLFNFSDGRAVEIVDVFGYQQTGHKDGDVVIIAKVEDEYKFISSKLPRKTFDLLEDKDTLQEGVIEVLSTLVVNNSRASTIEKDDIASVKERIINNNLIKMVDGEKKVIQVGSDIIDHLNKEVSAKSVYLNEETLNAYAEFQKTTVGEDYSIYSIKVDEATKAVTYYGFNDDNDVIARTIQYGATDDMSVFNEIGNITGLAKALSLTGTAGEAKKLTKDERKAADSESQEIDDIIYNLYNGGTEVLSLEKLKEYGIESITSETETEVSSASQQ